MLSHSHHIHAHTLTQRYRYTLELSFCILFAYFRVKFLLLFVFAFVLICRSTYGLYLCDVVTTIRPDTSSYAVSKVRNVYIGFGIESNVSFGTDSSASSSQNFMCSPLLLWLACFSKFHLLEMYCNWAPISRGH